jgi:hypothetical protein
MRDGIGMTADKFCTEQDIAAELAAAGSGDSSSGGATRSIIGLAAAGLGMLALGALVRARA